MISSRASEEPERAWLASFKQSFPERGSAGERNFATLGQNERPCEKQDKTGPTKTDLSKKVDKFIKLKLLPVAVRTGFIIFYFLKQGFF